MLKNPPANAGDAVSIPASGRSPGGEHGNPLHYSWLGNPMDRGAWWSMDRGVYGVPKSQTWLKGFSTWAGYETKPTKHHLKAHWRECSSTKLHVARQPRVKKKKKNHSNSIRRLDGAQKRNTEMIPKSQTQPFDSTVSQSHVPSTCLAALLIWSQRCCL